jgi:gliding motility-associated-like protein
VVFNTVQSLQVVKNEGKWYVIMVGGHASSGIISRVVKVELGASITNTNPTGTNWGNIGNLAYPVDLHLFQEGNRWYGLTLNAENATLTRFDFSNSFDNVPVGQNLGNPGGNFAYPTGIYAIKENSNWYVFVTNDEENPNLIRLDFGNSLLNTPSPVNLGNPDKALNKTRDIVFLKECGKITAFAVNGATYDQLVRLEFGDDLLSVPKGVNLGNVGNFSFPHSISKFFRVGSDVYTFVTNVYSATITRLRFGGCSNASIPNSSVASPAPFSYNAPGTYTVTQTLDMGLPTQTATCRNIVVLAALPHQPVKNISICEGDSIKLGTSGGGASGTYLWNNGAAADSQYISTPGYHWIETTRAGCSNRDSFFVSVKPSPKVFLGNDTLICGGGSLLLNAANPGAAYLWNTGATTQTISVNSAGDYIAIVYANGCKGTDTISVNIFDIASSDFSYKKDICDAMTVVYTGVSDQSATIDWDFGDGITLSGAPMASHHYAAFGTYDVVMNVGIGGCSKSITRKVTIGLQNDPQLVMTPDTTICLNTPKQLRAARALSYCWFPADHLDDPSAPSPTTTTTQDIVYYLNAEVMGTNLVVNGDFSQGNTGILSSYVYNTPNTIEGQYYTGANPNAWNGGLNNCRDHTTGAGLMMMVNGSPQVDAVVWKQTIPVSPDTEYAFSTWIQSLTAQNPAKLEFSINGRELRQAINAPSGVCQWEEFYASWNSGSATTAEIAIINKNTQLMGNDFALDDISFATVFIKRDSVRISVNKPLITAVNDTIVCAAKPVRLGATGAQTYTWSPSIALSDPAVADPVALPDQSTQYIVTGLNAYGCVAKDTVQVDVFTKPLITRQADTSICRNTPLQLWITGGASYAWSPGATISDPSIATPVVTPAQPTKYDVLVTDANGCEHTDSVKIDFVPDPVFAVNGEVRLCKGDTVVLNASGGDLYSWSPGAGMINSSVSNPAVSPAQTTAYTVTITESTCQQSSTLQTTVTVSPLPDVRAYRSNDIDCSYGDSRLTGTGARTYQWTPSQSLNNASLPGPVATPRVTTTYLLQGTDRNGCVNYDSVLVKVGKGNQSGYLMPTAFTPNNDGLNDCYGIKFWGLVDNIEISIFDRWGMRLFFSKDPRACWDGTFKGEKQPSGVYVYMIKASTACEPEVFKKGTFTLVR